MHAVHAHMTYARDAVVHAHGTYMRDVAVHICGTLLYMKSADK